jgi:hypothetical protein
VCIPLQCERTLTNITYRDVLKFLSPQSGIEYSKTDEGGKAGFGWKVFIKSGGSEYGVRGETRCAEVLLNLEFIFEMRNTSVAI